jgi:hypothetical protein
VTLDARKAALTIALAEPPLPAMHPQMAEVFRQKATTLAAGLEHDEQRDAARQALRGFLDKIVIPPATDCCRSSGKSDRCWPQRKAGLSRDRLQSVMLFAACSLS